MIFPNVAIAGFGALDISGYCSAAGQFTWDADQKGAEDVKRSQVLSKMYLGFGKLNLPDRLAFSAASLALSTIENFDGLSTGIVCGLPMGSLSTDRAYIDSVFEGTPAPALFSATLPSSTIADIAIYFGIKGPDRVIAGTTAPLLGALESALMMLINQKCEQVLFVSAIEAINNENKEESFSNGAFALLLKHPQPQSELPLLEYDCTLSGDIEQGLAEQQVFSTLIQSLKDKKRCRIPVSQHGFKGYISLI